MLLLLTVFAISDANDRFDNSVKDIFSDTSVRYLLVPLQKIEVHSNQNNNDEIENQFYVTSFNQLLSLELQKNKLSYVVDSLNEYKKILMKLSDSLDNYDKTIGDLLNKFNCSRIVYAVACSLQQSDIQHEGWRHNRSGPSYERPVQTIVEARIKFEIINSEGKTVIKSDVEGKSKKPFMYSFFKRFSKNSDIRSYARSLYGPPGLKAIYGGITKFLLLQTSDL